MGVGTEESVRVVVAEAANAVTCLAPFETNKMGFGRSYDLSLRYPYRSRQLIGRGSQ